jgi:hypothetical protein
VKYFWYWNPENRFPPDPIIRPEEFDDGDRLNISCTQTDLPAQEESSIIKAWCELLPQLSGIRFLWFSSRVRQEMFEAASQLSSLEGLYIKWSGITDLMSIQGLHELKYFHLGQSGYLNSIEPLANCLGLRWLGLELLSRIRDLGSLAPLVGLEGLSLEGSMSTAWQVSSLKPLSHLTNLRYLSLANLRSEDRSLSGVLSLEKLATFRYGAWWNAEEVAEVKRRNHGVVFE